MCYSYMCCEKAACKLNGKNSGSLAELGSWSTHYGPGSALNALNIINSHNHHLQ